MSSGVARQALNLWGSALTPVAWYGVAQRPFNTAADIACSLEIDKIQNECQGIRLIGAPGGLARSLSNGIGYTPCLQCKYTLVPYLDSMPLHGHCSTGTCITCPRCRRILVAGRRQQMGSILCVEQAPAALPL